jgi:ribosomal protein L11 methyltransferase
MTAFKVSARTDSDTARSLSGLLGEIIEPLATAVALFEDAGDSWCVEAYYEARPDMTALRTALKLHLADATPFQVSALALITVEDENWVAKSQAALPPVQAGQFFVHGSHDRQKAHGRLSAIEIDAGEAFGTAHHATLRAA